MTSEAHVLVVDDDLRLRNLLQRYLAENGFRVTTADDAADARAKMRFVQPDLVVLDVMMPGETGLSLTESMRREKSDVPILLLTARGAPEDRIAGFEAGADDYLPKPFDPYELVLRIRAMLRRVAPSEQHGPVQLGALSFDTARDELSGQGGRRHPPDGGVRRPCSPCWPARPVTCCPARRSPRLSAWTKPASAPSTCR